MSNIEIQTQNDGMVYIHEVNFDIFACPAYTGQKDRGVVGVEEISTISE